MEAKLYIQCKYPETNETGDFITDLNKKPISPCFNDLISLFQWLDINYPNRKQNGYSGYIL